jgi:hypothetical protein
MGTFEAKRATGGTLGEVLVFIMNLCADEGSLEWTPDVTVENIELLNIELRAERQQCQLGTKYPLSFYKFVDSSWKMYLLNFLDFATHDTKPIGHVIDRYPGEVGLQIWRRHPTLPSSISLSEELKHS